MTSRKKILKPEDWDLKYNSVGELILNQFNLADLAAKYKTPLYVFNEKVLIDTADKFRNCAARIFYGKSSVFYPFKCNSVPAVINAVRLAGLSAEVMTEFELELALKSGYNPSEIIVNGPCKTDRFLFNCLKQNVSLIVIDSISELLSLIKILNSDSSNVNLLLRVNPNYIPKGLSKSSATGSKACSFGLDKKEILEALRIIQNCPKLNFKGIHFHIGTGIRNPKAYSGVIKKLYPLFKKIKSLGFEIEILNVGGGFASMTTRELSSFEMIASQAFGSYRLKFGNQKFYSFEDYMNEIKQAVLKFFDSNTPIIYFEPGRCLTSPAQLLLLTVQRIKERNGKKWLITDGGLGTITMPTYYEYHEIFLCNQFNRTVKEKVTITGPCCFASDLVYKNKLLPQVKEGAVLALMDTGAYFNALESSFNFNKPAIISVNYDECRIVRRRETFQDMIGRDKNNSNFSRKEIYNEIYSSQK
jgi:diaminopimelate decarboxylase